MNEFKERKLAEFGEKFTTFGQPSLVKSQDAKQFISDLIDEMIETKMENDDYYNVSRIPENIVKIIRQDTLRHVLMSEEYVAGLFTDKLLAELYNNTIKNKAKEIWGIDLSKD